VSKDFLQFCKKSKLLYLAWDSGLKLGHRVHEVSDILKASREDITIKTSLMESRFITGSTFTWIAIEKALDRVKKENTKEYILAKINEAHIRRAKYPISMQPNIKEGEGGLRDSQLLYWIATTVYNVHHLKELTGVIFKEDEYKEYRIAIELLFSCKKCTSSHYKQATRSTNIRFYASSSSHVRFL
jgi:[protein-PII] uridylyltransferase